MAYYLKYYRKENNDYDMYNITYTSIHEARHFIEECCAFYGFAIPRIRFKLMKNEGLYSEKNSKITLKIYLIKSSKKIKILSIAHELAHHFDVLTYGSYNKTNEYTKTGKRGTE